MTQRNEQEFQRGLDLLDDYRYGRLTAEDTAWMAAALERWPELQAELEERDALAGMLRSGVAQGEAPVALPDAVLRAIEEQAANAGAVPVVKRRRGGMLPWLSAAAVLALVAVSLPVAQKVFEQDRDRASAETRTAVRQDADQPLTSDDADKARVPAMARIPESVMEAAKAEADVAPAEHQAEAMPADAMSLKAGAVASDGAPVVASEAVEAPGQPAVESRSSAMVDNREFARKSSESNPPSRELRLRASRPDSVPASAASAPAAGSIAREESADSAPARTARPMASAASDPAPAMGYSAPAAAAPAITARESFTKTAAATRTPVPAATVVPSDTALKFSFGEFQTGQAVPQQSAAASHDETVRMLGVESTGIVTMLYDDLTTATMVTSDTLSSGTVPTTPVVEVWN